MLLFDGCFDLISNEKISIAIRRIILGAITVCYLGLTVGITIVDNLIVKTFLILVIALILRVLTKLWIKVCKNKIIYKVGNYHEKI